MKKIRKMVWCGCMVLAVILCYVMLSQEIHWQKRYLQTKVESNLPQAKETDRKENIRVLIRTNGFSQIGHGEVQLKSEKGFTLICQDEVKEYVQGEVIRIAPDDVRFQTGTIQIKNNGSKITIASLKRGYGEAAYRGDLELFRTAEGIVIINELLLEEYLYAVVPSEMPASYELEALKAQAVCARSYAYNQSRNYSYPEYRAHVDDSTSFQVYGNSLEKERTIRAVQETNGEKIWYAGKVATAYYYSTSGGKSASITAWGGEFNAENQYLKSIDICDGNGEAYEKNLPWHRWTAVVPEQIMSDLVELNTKSEIGKLLNLAITKRGDGGIVQEITAVGTTGKVVVETENKIRRALGGAGYQITKQDGSKIDSTTLLPSAFFSIEKKNGTYMIAGGGYGHGIGMSQNGANEMAKQGKNYKQIIQTFYSGVKVE